MKRLLLLAVLGMLLGSAAGCRFWDCLWHGPAYRQPCPPAVACPSPCPPSCAPCDAGVGVPAGASVAPAIGPPVIAPGPEAGAPQPK
jgi:hypothetical protein